MVGRGHELVFRSQLQMPLLQTSPGAHAALSWRHGSAWHWPLTQAWPVGQALVAVQVATQVPVVVPGSTRHTSPVWQAGEQAGWQKPPTHVSLPVQVVCEPALQGCRQRPLVVAASHTLGDVQPWQGSVTHAPLTQVWSALHRPPHGLGTQ